MKNKQPSWSKLSDNLQTLANEPWKFDLFKALNLLETEWAEADEMASGLSSRVLITPNKELGFPVADIKSGQLITSGRGVFHLQSNYSGLYGADAAMPHYLLEQAARDDDAGKRTRAFLDIFNHLYYCLLYQSWKKSQLNINGVGAQQFDQILGAILSERQTIESHAGITALKTASAYGMAKLLNDEFNRDQIKVNDSYPHWQTIKTPSSLGQAETTVLGESLILGQQVLVSGGKVTIELGCFTDKDAIEFSPGGTKSVKLQKLVESQLPTDLPWECSMYVEHECKTSQQLGQPDIVLGVNSHMGEVSPKTVFQTFKDSQYKQRSVAFS